jgi:hypothetical protein
VEQKVFTTEDRTNRLLEALSVHGGEAVTIHGDARVFISRLEEGRGVAHTFDTGRAGYLYAISGAVEVEGSRLTTGDAVVILDEPSVTLSADEDTELIMVDVPTTYDPVGIWAR